MPATDDLTAVRRLLDVPVPRDDVITAGRNRLDEFVRHEADGVRHWRRGPALARSSRRRPIAIGVAVACGIAAAATITTTMVLPRAASTAQPGGSPTAAKPDTAKPNGQRPRAGTVQQAILTAVGAVGDDIMYIKVTNSGMPKGVSPNVQYWLWPARAAVGQRVHLVMAEDGMRTEMTFTQTARFPPQVTAATTLRIDPTEKTWTTYSGIPVPGIPLQSSLHLLDKQYLLRDFMDTSKVISRHATVGGQPAIEVSYPSANGLLHFLLWVNARTYLPLRMDKLHFLNGYPNSVQHHDFRFLPPTPANLAKVTVTVPPGYKRVAG